MDKRLEWGWEARVHPRMGDPGFRHTIKNLDLDFLREDEKAVLTELDVRREDGSIAVGITYHVYHEKNGDENSLRYERTHTRRTNVDKFGVLTSECAVFIPSS